MKNSIIDLIAGYFKKTPKRLAIARNVLLVLIALSGVVITLNGQLFIAPDWVLSVCSPTGIIAMAGAAFGLQAAKSEAGEPEYQHVTYGQRMAMNTTAYGAGFTVFQTDAQIGYWTITSSLTWDYVGSRPPHR